MENFALVCCILQRYFMYFPLYAYNVAFNCLVMLGFY